MICRNYLPICIITVSGGKGLLVKQINEPHMIDRGYRSVSSKMHGLQLTDVCRTMRSRPTSNYYYYLSKVLESSGPLLANNLLTGQFSQMSFPHVHKSTLVSVYVCTLLVHMHLPYSVPPQFKRWWLVREPPSHRCPPYKFSPSIMPFPASSHPT